MQHELIILSSSPVQPLFDDREAVASNKESSTPTSYGSTIDKRLKSSPKAPSNPENAEADFRLASSLLLNGGLGRAIEGVLAIATEAQDKTITTGSVARAEEKKTAHRKKDDSSVNTGRKKKREADKTATPEGGRARKNVRKGKATGRVSTYFGPGNEQENADHTLTDLAVGRAGSPPPRRRTSWTPPKDNHSTIVPDEGFVQISKFEYKAAQTETSAVKQSTFTIGRKIEVCAVSALLCNC
jgi:hypothetical protein